MGLCDKVKWFLAVEFNITDATEEQINLTIEEGISNCGDFEEYEELMNEWHLWHNTVKKTFDFPQSSIENEFDSINTFAKANPILCIAALQAITHLEDGLYIYLNAVTNEVEVFFEGEFMGEIAIKDGGIKMCATNYNFLDKAYDHIASFFPGVWL